MWWSRLVVLSVVLSQQSVSAALMEIPARVDPMSRPDADDNTVVLWQFEKGDASDSTRWLNTGTVRGKPKVVPDGRFGRCLSLGGGPDGVLLTEIRGMDATLASQQGGLGLSVEFSIRPRKSGFRKPSPQTIFELASSADDVAVGLDLLPGGRLCLRGWSLTKSCSEGKIEAGTWSHIAIVAYAKYWPGSIFVQASGAAALVNGSTFVTAFAETDGYQFPPGNMKEVFCLGNNLAGDAGFEGEIDEFRLSDTARKYYEVIHAPYLDPEKKRPLPRPAGFFRAPEREVFYESFDDPEIVNKLRAQSEDFRATGTPDEHEFELLDKEEATEKDDETTPKPQALVREAKVESCPGVRGNALAVSGVAHGALLRLPENIGDLSNGTLELWFRPADWDNMTLRPHRNSKSQYRNTRLRLLTLYGKPKDGKSEDVPLLELLGDRLRSESEAPFDLHPYLWSHVALIWGETVENYQPNLYLNGKWVGYDIRCRMARMAKPEIWKNCTPAYIRLGNNMGTVFDELRIYSYSFFREEVENSLARYTEQPMKELGAAVCTFDYRMSIGQLGVVVGVALKDVAAAASAKVSIDLPGRTVVGTIADFKGGKGRANLDVGELPEGNYTCSGMLFGRDGKELGRFTSTFTRVELPWLHNRIGLLDTVPEPFTPVSIHGDSVSTVGREYSVGGTGLFDSVVVGGEEILSAPMYFELGQAGQKVVLKPTGKARFGECTQVATSWEGEAGGPVTIRSAVTLEYDGMAKYELTIQPAGREVALESLSLVIPLKQEFAQLIHALPTGGNFRWCELARFLPLRDGLLWDSKTWSQKSCIEKKAVGNFVPMVWLGGLIKGLCWFGDNDRGWVPNNAQPAITVTRNKAAGTVTLALHFVSEPYKLVEPRRIVFGLIATPAKPLRKDHRLWNRGNTETVGHIGGRLTSCEAFAPWEIGVKQNCFDYWPKNYDWEFAKRASDQQRRSKHPKYAGGKALMLYHDRRWIPSSRESVYFNWEWDQGSYPPSKVDCLVWYMDQWISRGIMDGIYIDDVCPVPDLNTETGTAYVLPDGKVQPGNALFAYREYLKRVYNIFHKNGKPPIITTHMTSTLEIPLHSFVSVIFDGEDAGRFGDPNVTFMDAWPLERLLTIDNAERTGLVTVLMLKGAYATRGRDQAAWAHMIRRMYRSATAIWLLFDMNQELPAPIQKAWAPYKGLDVKVQPFWRNAELVSAEPLFKEPVKDEMLPLKALWWNTETRQSMAQQPFRVTVFQKSDRALLVIANFLRTPVEGRIKIDLDKLGVPKEKQATAKVKDVDEWPKAGGVDLASLDQPRPEEMNPDDMKTPLTKEEQAEPEADEILNPNEAPDMGPSAMKDGEFTLRVEAQDFRLIELTWEGP